MSALFKYVILLFVSNVFKKVLHILTTALIISPQISRNSSIKSKSIYILRFQIYVSLHLHQNLVDFLRICLFLVEPVKSKTN